jgi:predicted DNA-binding protein (MmcQ/YjbR family)
VTPPDISDIARLTEPWRVIELHRGWMKHESAIDARAVLQRPIPGVPVLWTGRSVNVMAMNPAELRDYCLSFAGAAETFPFGPRTSVFKVAGKMFAISQLDADSLRVSLKCDPELAEALRGAHAAVLPGYHLDKRHWNTVIIDGSLPDEAVGDMIEDSYDLVVSKLPQSRRHALGWRGRA